MSDHAHADGGGAFDELLSDAAAGSPIKRWLPGLAGV